MTDTGLALFDRLYRIGNTLEDLRNGADRQGVLWLQLDAIRAQLDAVIDTLAAVPPGDGCARHTAAWRRTRHDQSP